MDDILIKISQYGVMPILIMVIAYLHSKNKDHLKTIKEKDAKIARKIP